jgi:restriction endonuclease S subunit
MRAEWMKHSSGNRRDPNINKSIVAQMDCPLPPVSRQKLIARYLSEKITQADKLRGALQVQLESINKMTGSLQYKAFNGEL